MGTLGVLGGAFASATHASVIVVANRFDKDVRFFVDTGGEEELTFKLKPGTLVPFPAADKSRLVYRHNGVEQRYVLDADSAYFFVASRAHGLELRKIGLTTERPRIVIPGITDVPAKPGRPPKAGKRVVIDVMILVDEEERKRRDLWEPVLRKRVAKASEIISRFAPVEFKVVEVGTWNSDNRKRDFLATMSEFEAEVRPKRAQIAIGFTSQYEIVRKKGTHLGGTRGPLHTHVLVREWSKYLGEDERLEVLVHELGHILGAAHSPEPRSVMRPSLGDDQVKVPGFQIGFDPLNTLAMYMVGQQLQSGGYTRFSKMPMSTRRRLADVYAEIAIALPKDPAAKRYLELLGARMVKVKKPKNTNSPSRREGRTR